jgi:hypothetical protein
MNEGLGAALGSHTARIQALAELVRARARLDAAQARLLAAMAGDPDPYRDGTGTALSEQWVREEAACVLRVSCAVAGGLIADAVLLVERLPATLACLEAGAITGGHARRLVEASHGLPAAVLADVQARVLPRAGQQTVSQFGASVRRAVLACDTREREQRVAAERDQRRVVFTPHSDTMTELWALLPAEQAAALRERVHDLATDAAPGDQRTLDQRRADALCSLAGPAGAPNGVGLQPTVGVTVALSTLLHLDEQPGELAGYGPIPAVLARQLAHDPTGSWRRLLTDAQGNVVEVSPGTYRPGAALDRLVRHRHPRCTFPGCGHPSARADLDHRTPFTAGGPTTAENLHPLCRRHHRLKHTQHWRAGAPAADGTITWQSPTGSRYAQPPPDQPRDITSDPPHP